MIAPNEGLCIFCVFYIFRVFAEGLNRGMPKIEHE